MNNSCLNAEKIEIYLNSAKNSAVRKEIDAHLAKCPSCKVIMEAAMLGQPKALVDTIKKVDAILSTSKPSKLEKGQIWRLSRNTKASKNPIVIITDVAKSKLNVVVACLNPEEEFIDKKDAIVKASENPMSIEFMAECWNQRTIKSCELENYIGVVSAKAFTRIKKALTTSITCENVLAEEFRKQQIMMFSELGTAVESSSIIDTIVKRAYSVIESIEISCIELFGANEALTMAAATFPMDKLKKLLQAKDKNYSVRQIKGKDYITIYRKDNLPFKLIIRTKSDKEAVFESDKDGQLLLENGFPVDKKSFKNLILETKDEQ